MDLLGKSKISRNWPEFNVVVSSIGIVALFCLSIIFKKLAMQVAGYRKSFKERYERLDFLKK